MRTPILITALVVLAGVLGTWWFLRTFERVTTTEFVPYQGEARFNRFYAAESLLRELAITADSRTLRTPGQWLPETSATLVLPVTALQADAGERENLFNWVGQGGHLILFPPSEPTQGTHALFAGFGVRVLTAEPNESPDAASQLTPVSNTVYSGNLQSRRQAYQVRPAAAEPRFDLIAGSKPDAVLQREDGMFGLRSAWGSARQAASTRS